MSSGQTFWEDVQVGQEIPSLAKWPDSRQLVLWAAASGDFAQLHYDEQFARRAGMPGIIVHGALKHAFLGQLLSDWIGHGRESRIVTLQCDYRGMDTVGGEIKIRGVVTEKREETGAKLVDLDVWTENSEGVKTSPGRATVALRSRG